MFRLVVLPCFCRSNSFHVCHVTGRIRLLVHSNPLTLNTVVLDGWPVGLELLHEFLCCVVRRSTHYVLLSWWVGLELLHGFLCCVVRRSTHYVLLVGRP